MSARGYVADANLLIALLNPRDALHEASIPLVAGLDPDKMIYVHPINIAEVLGFYETRYEREQKWDMLGELGRFVAAGPDDSPMGEAEELAELRYVTGMKMPDVCAIQTALTWRSVLITHDQRLAKAARRIGLAVIPEVAA